MLSKRIFRAVASLSLFMVVGCGTLPDASPFADSTLTLENSLRASGLAVATSLEEMEALDPANKLEHERLSRKFETAWQIRQKAAQAMTTYAQAISNLVAAGQEGKQTVAVVADGLSELATTLGIPVVSATVSVATDLVSIVVEQIAIVRASDGLQDAMSRAQPVMDRITEILVQESGSELRDMLTLANKNAVSSIRGAYDRDEAFYMRVLEVQNADSKTVFSSPQSLARRQILDQIEATTLTKIKQRDQLLTVTRLRNKLRMQLLDAQAETARTWARSHRDLSNAIREKRKVDVVELQQSIAELKALSKKVSDL